MLVISNRFFSKYPYYTTKKLLFTTEYVTFGLQIDRICNKQAAFFRLSSRILMKFFPLLLLFSCIPYFPMKLTPINIRFLDLKSKRKYDW
ncbi:hypothetical protein BN990_04427 [Virgibacillus salexigens]|uniref:Uncharacterized protein n=1 Tax=Virgibacillus massiliensis TaxID=1462526 RepID=A0A024QII8_9BACI|nr:hypothetical protein BN990_04427 [Virgibacillus massiliensis]